MGSIKSFDKYAIFEAGGKQYQALEGKTVAVEKIEGEVGTSVEFKALFRKTGEGAYEVGKPFLDSRVKAEIIKQTKGPKITVFVFKRRKKSQVKKGHRQPETIVRILAI